LQRLASNDDLYVLVPDKEGKHKWVPYLQVIKQAEDSSDKNSRL
jgi:hypothetical protein